MSKLSKTLFFVFLGLIYTPMVFGFTVDGPLNWNGPGGGNVVFDNPIVVTQFNVVNNIYRFTGTVWGGDGTGNLGFDCDTGDNMTITSITPTSLTYTITGAGQQRIYFQGYEKPNQITGGTAVNGPGQTIVVTTAGAGTVTLSWFTSFNNIINSITSYLVIVGLVPLVLAGALIINANETGEFDRDFFLVIVALIVALFTVIVVWVSITKNY